MDEIKKDAAKELNLLADIKCPKVDTTKPLPYYLRRRMKEYSLLAEINEFGTFKSDTRCSKEHIDDLISGKCIDSVAKLVEESDYKDLKIKCLTLAAKYILSELVNGDCETYKDIEEKVGYDNLIKMANYLMYRRHDLFGMMASTLLNKYKAEDIFVGEKGKALMGLCIQRMTFNFANREATERLYKSSVVIHEFIDELCKSKDMEVRGLNFVAQSVASFSDLVGTDKEYTRSVCAAIDILKNPKIRHFIDKDHTPVMELAVQFNWSHIGMSKAEIEDDAKYVREHVGMMVEDTNDIFPDEINERLKDGDPDVFSVYEESGKTDSDYYLVPKSIFDKFPKFIIRAWDKIDADGNADKDVYYRAMANLTLEAKSIKEVSDFIESAGSKLTDVIDNCVSSVTYGHDDEGEGYTDPCGYVLMNIMRLLNISEASEEFRNHCRDKFVSLYAQPYSDDNPFFMAIRYGEPGFHAVHYTNEQVEEIIKEIGYNRSVNLLTYDNYDVIAKYHDVGEYIPFNMLYDTKDTDMEVVDKLFNLATADERKYAPFPIEYMKQRGVEVFGKYVTSENVDRYIEAYGLDATEELIPIPIMKILMFNAPSLEVVVDRYIDIIMNDMPARNLILGVTDMVDHIRKTDLLPEVMRAKEIDDDAKAQLLYTAIITDEHEDLKPRAIVSYVNMLNPNNKYAGLCLTLAARKAVSDEDKAAIDNCIANINMGAI